MHSIKKYKWDDLQILLCCLDFQRETKKKTRQEWITEGIFPIQGLNLGLLCWRLILYHFSRQENQRKQTGGKIMKAEKDILSHF